MRYFVDTEYIWTPREGRIVPLSIGIVCEDGREFYRQNQDCYPDSPFVAEHVWSRLDNLDWWRHRDGNAFPWTTLHDMRADVIAFVGDDTPEFWGDYAAFDYVVLSMVMGEFADWPQGWPMHFNDCRQEAAPELPSADPHHALADARAIRDSWNAAFREGVRQ